MLIWEKVPELSQSMSWALVRAVVWVGESGWSKLRQSASSNVTFGLDGLERRDRA